MKKLTIQIEIHDNTPSVSIKYKTFRDAFQFTLDGCREKIQTCDYGLDGKIITPEGIIYEWKIIPPSQPTIVEDILK